MPTRSRTTFKKRQKELARMEKQRDKAARRMQRKLEPSAGMVIEAFDPNEGLDVDDTSEEAENTPESSSPTEHR
jgi:hypothetical protein